MAAIVLLSDRIELDITTEALAAFAGEIEVDVAELTDLELASAIINKIDGLDDAAWEAMTMALKEWSNTINNKKIEIVELEKKEATAAKAQKTKKSNVEASEFPATPAAIKNFVNECKNKADIGKAIVGIAKALGMDAAPKVAKSWTVAKQKEEVIKLLVKPKAAKPSKPAADTATKTPKPAADTATKTPKPAGPARTKAPSAAEVKTAKAGAAATAANNAATKGGGIEDGEPFRKTTTAYLVWAPIKASKAKGGIAVDAIKTKFEAALDKSDFKCTNIPGRVTRVIAELKKKGFIERLETGNYVNKALVAK